MLDSPTNNFPTYDGLRPNRPTHWEGNLLTETSTNTITRSVDTNFRPSTGKWYLEVFIKVDGYNGGQNATAVGIANEGFVLAGNEFKGHNNSVAYEMSGNKLLNVVGSSYGSSYATGDIIGIAYDVDGDNITFYKNGVSQGELTSGFSVSNGRLVVVTNSSSATGQRYHANFGQDSSFAGNKTAQGNQDGGGIGDFFYEPPSGFLALCTKNLPDPAVIPSEHFNTVTYSGDSTSPRTISGVGFQPDFVWAKTRSDDDGHYLWDEVRGTDKNLRTDGTWDESAVSGASGGIVSDNASDGFITKAGSSNSNNVNQSGRTYVAWNWKANGAGVSNTSGSITSTVSANADAGFSIVNQYHWTRSILCA